MATSAVTQFLNDIQIAGNVVHVTENLQLPSGTITFAAGTIIIFEGGKLVGTGNHNCTISGNNTSIVAPPYCIFYDIAFSGSWNVTECYAEWWGAMGNGNNDDSNAIQNALNSPFEKVLLLNKKYAVKKTITISKQKSLEGTRPFNGIDGTTGTDVVGTPQLYAVNSSNWSSSQYVVAISSPYVTIKNLTVYNAAGANARYGISTTGNNCYRLVLDGLAACGFEESFRIRSFLTTIERCTAIGTTIGFHIYRLSNDINTLMTSTTMTNCFVKNYKNYAYLIENLTYSTIINCCADDFNTTSHVSDGDYNWFVFRLFGCSAMSLINCAAEKAAKGISMDSCINVKIQNSWFDMPYMTSTSKNGRIARITNSSMIEIDGLNITNWECTGWAYNASTPGWKHVSNIFMIENTSTKRLSCRLHNVFYRGWDRAKSSSAIEIHQKISQGLVLKSGNNIDLQIEYDWAKSSVAGAYPTELDGLVGVGWTYHVAGSGLIFWNGQNWQSVISYT